MYEYTFTFNGRKIGAIGSLSQFKVSVIAENDDLARLSLYENFEHITVVALHKIRKVS